MSVKNAIQRDSADACIACHDLLRRRTTTVEEVGEMFLKLVHAACLITDKTRDHGNVAVTSSKSVYGASTDSLQPVTRSNSLTALESSRFSREFSASSLAHSALSTSA